MSEKAKRTRTGAATTAKFSLESEPHLSSSLLISTLPRRVQPVLEQTVSAWTRVTSWALLPLYTTQHQQCRSCSSTGWCYLLSFRTNDTDIRIVFRVSSCSCLANMSKRAHSPIMTIRLSTGGYLDGRSVSSTRTLRPPIVYFVVIHHEFVAAKHRVSIVCFRPRYFNVGNKFLFRHSNLGHLGHNESITYSSFSTGVDARNDRETLYASAVQKTSFFSS